jgi:HD-GYP domain-containing protein (c-di-GMP phosphodiesterase class II)
MSLDSDEVTFVARCGIVHDIGKLHTPQEVLLAARRLSDDEWAVMQRHVIDGWEIAVETPELRPFAPAIRGHHERFDGRGYPDELPGSELALATRIVSVADSFNAMIADRPYRPPMSPMRAIEELERHRATQFDPDCVDAMIDVVLART